MSNRRERPPQARRRSRLGQAIQHAGAERVWPLLRSHPYGAVLAALCGVVFCAGSALGLRLALDRAGGDLSPDEAALLTVAPVDGLRLPATIPPPPVTASPTPPATTATPTPVPSPVPTVTGVTYDASRTYAFPVASDPALYRWTHYHWDGANAADVEARFGLTRAQFDEVTHAPLVAITDGVVTDYSGPTGGTGYLLQGDDGLDYYYGHMSEQWVPDGARVAAGDPLGRVGNSGATAQYIERHLHLAIGPRGTLQSQPAAINSAEHLQAIFGLPWQELPPAEVPASQPVGSPVADPTAQIVTSFADAERVGLPEPAVEIGLPAPTSESVEVVAPLAGVVNLIRWNDTYGTRIQIANVASGSTVVISGVQGWLVTDGDVVTRGEVIGRWIPAQQPRLHYMIFQNGVIIDPAPSLGLPVTG